MKNELRAIAMKCACIVGLAVMASGAIADPGDDNDPNGTIVGTWLSKVTTPNPPPGVPPVFLSLATFTGSGQAIEANNTTQDRTVALGDWTRTGHRTFVRTMTFFVFGPGHVFANFTQVTSTIELSLDGETYTATNQFQLYNGSGMLLASGQNTSVANRCGLGDAIPACIPM